MTSNTEMVVRQTLRTPFSILRRRSCPIQCQGRTVQEHRVPKPESKVEPKGSVLSDPLQLRPGSDLHQAQNSRAVDISASI